MTRVGVRVAMIAVPLAFLAVFFVYPVASIVGRGVVADGSLDLAPVADVIADGHLRGVLWFTTWQATVSTLLTLVVGLPLAAALAQFEFRGREVVRSLVAVPFVLPTVVVATAFTAVLGRGGPLGALGWDRGVAPILAAHVFFNVAVVVRAVGGFWANLDPHQVDAARVLGASRTRAFVSVTLPRLAPALAAAATIVFLFTFTSFGVVLLLGGPGTSTLEVEIYLQTARFLDLEAAAGLAIVQLLAVIAVLVVSGRFQAERAVSQRLVGRASTARPVRTGTERGALVATLVAAVAFLGGPLLVLVARSLDGGLDSYRALVRAPRRSASFVPLDEAIRNSLMFAAAATAIALVVGTLAAVFVARRTSRSSRALDLLVMLPLGTSAVTIGFGFLVALDEPPLDLRTSRWLIPIAHALVAIPFVVRIVVPALRSIDPRVRDAAAVLGASPARVWREVDLPITARALTVAAGFAAAISLGEFGATIFIARPDVPTVPIAIARLLGRPGNFGTAMAMATVLMAITAAVVLLVDRVRIRDVGEF
ncbi:MAG TPA: iron ABC transporter permease [Acidimicrobiia bacterium]|nr:iron ABC transporter permease [Acidimicrobiia bacterium]